MKYGNQRQYGDIAGDLKELQPFIYIFRRGGMGADARGPHAEGKKGIFVVNESYGNGCFIKHGILLPLSTCKDERIRAALLMLGKTLSHDPLCDGAEARRRQAQMILDATFGGNIKVAAHADMGGNVEFDRSRAFFEMLAENFSYVEEVDDDPEGIAVPTKLQPFPCKSYGEYLEWYYERMDARSWGWDHCTPCLVFEGTSSLGNWHFTRDGLERPHFGLDRLFQINPTVEDEPATVRLEMENRWDWIYLHLGVGSQTLDAVLSNSFPPVELLIEWLKSIGRGDLPVRFQIEEEGPEKKFEAYATDDPDRILLRILNAYCDEQEGVFIEAIVNRRQFVDAFRIAMREFFRTEFNPEAWYCVTCGEYERPHLGDQILADPWFQV
ncbi:MAG: hypothetical protein FDZ69_04675 [Deltaproteobacteria bacterium]|nr:MAG: hypothetical protein FDZ69_04675 [Deltaproteobacteria bacterium]